MSDFIKECVNQFEANAHDDAVIKHGITDDFGKAHYMLGVYNEALTNILSQINKPEKIKRLLHL
jgi:hypothetical protein